MGEVFSRKWKAARDEIRALEESQITRQKFENICSSHTLNKDEQSALAGLMHDVGNIVHFADDDGLNQVVVLQPEWLTKAIGYVLEDKATNDNMGVLRHVDVARIWHNDSVEGRDIYDNALHPFFLRLMEKFDVSYRLDDGTSSLVTQLLPARTPQLCWSPSGGDRREMKLLCVMGEQPPGIIPWLIVRTHRYTAGVHWQRGMQLKCDPHGEALVTLHDRELTISVVGQNPGHFLSILSDSVEHLIRQRWPGLKYSLAVPCPLDEGAEQCAGRLRLQVLHKRRLAGHTTMVCPDCGEDLDLNQLLTGFPNPLLSTGEKLARAGTNLGEPIDRRDTQPSVAAQILRTVLQAKVTDVPESPHLFTLVPATSMGWSGSDTMSNLRLTLWCQYPDGEHPLCQIGSDEDGEYVFRRRTKSITGIAPYALLVSRALRSVLPLAKLTAKETLISTLFENVEEQLGIMEKTAEKMLEISGNADERQAVREYNTLLKAIDEKQRWGGLKRVLSAMGDYLWLCPVHYRVFEPTLPEIIPKVFDVFLSHNGGPA